jgi:hypothetical protein
MLFDLYHNLIIVSGSREDCPYKRDIFAYIYDTPSIF